MGNAVPTHPTTWKPHAGGMDATACIVHGTPTANHGQCNPYASMPPALRGERLHALYESMHIFCAVSPPARGRPLGGSRRFAAFCGNQCLRRMLAAICGVLRQPMPSAYARGVLRRFAATNAFGVCSRWVAAFCGNQCLRRMLAAICGVLRQPMPSAYARGGLRFGVCPCAWALFWLGHFILPMLRPPTKPQCGGRWRGRKACP